MGALVLPAGVARALSPTDCASVEMDFADADAEKKCESGDAGDGQWRGSEQIMVVKGSGYFVYVSRLKSGYQSYVSEEDVRDFAGSFMGDLLKSPSAISAHGTVAGYNVATFSGKLADDPNREVGASPSRVLAAWWWARAAASAGRREPPTLSMAAIASRQPRASPIRAFSEY